VAIAKIAERVFQVPGEECRIVAAVGEGKDLLSVIRKVLVESGGNDGVGSIGSMDQLADRIAAGGAIAAQAAFRDLICAVFVLRGFFLDHRDGVTMAAVEGTSPDLTAAHTNLKMGPGGVSLFLFLAVVERPQEIDSKTIEAGVPNCLAELAILNLADKVMLATFPTKGDFEDSRSGFGGATI
jgi:hypothetical protein